MEVSPVVSCIHLECILSSHLHHLCSFDLRFLCYCCSYRCAHGNSLEQAVVFSVEKGLSSFQVQILHSHSHPKAPLSPPGTLSTFCLRPTLMLTVRLSTCHHPVPLVTHSWFVLFSTYSNPLPSPLPSPFPLSSPLPLPHFLLCSPLPTVVAEQLWSPKSLALRHLSCCFFTLFF